MGRQLGLEFPPNIEPLLAQGAEFLTAAFHAAGTLPADNRVAAITRSEEFFGGGAGRKLLLSVDYQQGDEALHRDLFVKYPRDFGDPLRELFSALMEPETRFALLSRRGGFPVAVPKCYYADYDPQTATGILITERIAFGRNGIEPFQDKCLDYQLAQPLEHYRALIKVIARLAGFHKSKGFGGEIERQFPYDRSVIREHDRIPHTPEVLQQKLELLQRFAVEHPGLLPENIRSKAFLDGFSRDAMRFLGQELPIKRFLNANADFIALNHWNANIDNAWFRRNAEGELEAGLLDWGSVGQMNVAQAVYGVLCACETDFWNARKGELLALFVTEYRRNGGPALDVDTLNVHMQLYVAMLGLAWMVDAPSIIRSQIPDLDQVQDRYDPKIVGDFLARAQLQLMTVFLNVWQTEDFGGVLDRFTAASS